MVLQLTHEEVREHEHDYHDQHQDGFQGRPIAGDRWPDPRRPPAGNEGGHVRRPKEGVGGPRCARSGVVEGDRRRRHRASQG